MMNRKLLLKGSTPKLLDSSITSHTLVGIFDSLIQVALDSIILLEFDKDKNVEG